MLALCGCGLAAVDLTPNRVPNTGSTTVHFAVSPYRIGDRPPAHNVEIAGRTLRSTDGAPELVLPALPVGEHEVLVDGQKSDAKLEVYEAQLLVEAIDVDQGDATLIIAPDGWTALIDTGPPGSAPTLLERMAVHGVKHLDLLVLSHSDNDHVGGAGALLRGADDIAGTADDLRPSAIWEDGSIANCGSQACRELLATGRSMRVPNPGETIERDGGFRFRVEASAGAVPGLAASGDALNNDNARSIVVSVCLEGFCGLVLGDLTGGGLNTPDIESAVAPGLPPMAWVRVGHHGSRTSSNRAIVDATRPRLAIFSLGDDNHHCHPAPEALSRWSETALVYATGAGQTNDAGECSRTDWPLRARHDCGHVTIRRAAAGTPTVSCGWESIGF